MASQTSPRFVMLEFQLCAASTIAFANATLWRRCCEPIMQILCLPSKRAVAAEQPFSSAVLCRLGKHIMPMLCRLESAISVQMFPFLCVLWRFGSRTTE